MRRTDTDHLIIGAGTTGLAYADTLIKETDAHVTLVDCQASQAGTGTTPTLSSRCTSLRPTTAWPRWNWAAGSRTPSA